LKKSGEAIENEICVSDSSDNEKVGVKASASENGDGEEEQQNDS
jgi:hypothetical protein